MVRRKEYTLEEIQRQRQKLTKRINKKEREIRNKWRDLVAPPDVEDTLQLWTNRAEAAFSLYDGFMTGYKLLRSFDFSFGRKKKKKTTGK